MRETSINYTKWEKTYHLKVTPEVLMEAVGKETGKDDMLVPFTYIAAWFKAKEKGFVSRLDATSFVIRKIGGRRWAVLNGTLSPSRNGWEIRARITCWYWCPLAFLAVAMTFLGIAGIMAAYSIWSAPSQSTGTSNLPWFMWILGPLFWTMLAGMMRSGMRAESEILVTFFEKLVAPYVDETATITSNADARDP